ncbi:MAG: ATP-binding cassette domain-containing protein, partial [Lachnospiraceae bacterium]|nr:ATP-binding cassette domain-containing protein [Lachnospiraceae bacterium]
MEKRTPLLSIKDLEVKFRVRGRILTAIRGISLDIYENESIAIVGESGSGKSVFTKTFAGMLDSNGFISNGSVVFNDPDLADTKAFLNASTRFVLKHSKTRLDEYSKLEGGAGTYRRMIELKAEKKRKATLSDEDEERIESETKEARYRLTEAKNLAQTFDRHSEKSKIQETEAEIKQYEQKLKALKKEAKDLIAKHKKELAADTEYLAQYGKEMAELKTVYQKEIGQEISEDVKERNLIVAKEIALSIGRYSFFRKIQGLFRLLSACKKAMRLGADLSDVNIREQIFNDIVLHVRYVDETEEYLHGLGVLDVTKIKYPKDWTQIRGKKIATVFQDPMTSLNPIITIGNQITSVILKHQNCSEIEARQRALKLMKQVGIPNAENRFDDYPFQYSGGMRQRIVIAIALSCQPKILICDEPTTALDVTIQAQILELLKELQKEYKYTIVFITHDLGVVANIADRVAVLYGGQIVELGTAEDVFFDPRHPYTW